MTIVELNGAQFEITSAGKVVVDDCWEAIAVWAGDDVTLAQSFSRAAGAVRDAVPALKPTPGDVAAAWCVWSLGAATTPNEAQEVIACVGVFARAVGATHDRSRDVVLAALSHPRCPAGMFDWAWTAADEPIRDRRDVCWLSSRAIRMQALARNPSTPERLLVELAKFPSLNKTLAGRRRLPDTVRRMLAIRDCDEEVGLCLVAQPECTPATLALLCASDHEVVALAAVTHPKCAPETLHGATRDPRAVVAAAAEREVLARSHGPLGVPGVVVAGVG